MGLDKRKYWVKQRSWRKLKLLKEIKRKTDFKRNTEVEKKNIEKETERDSWRPILKETAVEKRKIKTKSSS